MHYNLTTSQRELATAIVEMVRTRGLQEAFHVISSSEGLQFVLPTGQTLVTPEFHSPAVFLNLAKAGLLVVNMHGNANCECVLTGAMYAAVDTKFAEETTVPVSNLAQSHPPEIAMSLDRLRAKYPDPKKLGFLVMRFASGKPHVKIVEAVRKIGENHGLTIVRADDREYHADLWGNVRTYLHGCGFGIAIYERIDADTPNANVGLEVGYLMAMNKPVLLLKDKTLPAIQADLAGKLYKNFDPHDAENTIPDQVTKWLIDYGIVLTDSSK